MKLSLTHFLKHLFIDPICCLREAKALYSCEAEHNHELSFPQGALFSNGKKTTHRFHILRVFAFALKCL